LLEEEEEEKGNTAERRIRPAAGSRIGRAQRGERRWPTHGTRLDAGKADTRQAAMRAPAFRAFNVLGS